MATEHIDAGAPNLNLTQEEKRVYGLLFRQADSNNLGVVTGEVAVKFFEKTGLNSRVLGEIWQIADKENRGFLTPAGFSVVLRLIGHAQASREPTAELALNPGPLPRFEGVNIPPPPPLQSRPPPAATPSAGLVQTPTGLPTIPAQGPGGASIQIPALTPEKATQYASLFERQPLQSGNMLPGDAAKSIFEKSSLPNEVLGRIWQLADTEQRGALVMTEFVMSMHLLTCMKSGVLRTLPTILPAPLYEAATQRAPARGSPMAATPPVPPIPKQLSGTAQHQTQMRTGSPLARQPLAPPPPTTSHANSMSRVTPQGTGMVGGDWLVTPADKLRFDQIYDTMDTTRKGFITGEEAVPFFGQSNLSEDVLAQIWDLADINSKGQLTRDEFAVAMYLIRQQRMRRDGANTLPAVLPPNLVPPGMRAARAAPAAAAASAFDAPAVPQPAPPPAQPRSALDDLFGLTSSPTPVTAAPAQVQTSMATGGSNASKDPFSSGSPPAPGSPAAPLASQGTGFGPSNFKPFMPSSSFGLSLAPNKTGGSTGSAPAQLQVPAPIEEDLLGDTDPEINKKLTNETAELANMSNQISTLGKQMHDLQNKRNSTQQELIQASAQKKQLESKLAHLRTMYENEAREVRSLEQQLGAAKADTKKIQMEYAMLEATVTDLRSNKNQVLTGLQADQQENASLKEKIRVVNAEITALKPQIEKLKSEARQHKGLVAINKKQLSTNESERDRLKAEADELTKSNEELSRQISPSSPVSTSAQVASPTLSTTGANNPFFRRTASTDVIGTFASPPVKSVSDTAFNDIFGPFPPSASSTPPPTFKKPETSTSSPYATPGSGSPQLSRQVPATSSSEPPAPPESKQITSSFLPIREPADSISSSRQVSPPTSRIGFADATPTESSGPNPLNPDATGRSIGSGSGIVSDGDREGPKPASTFPQESKPAATAENMFGGPSADDTLKQTNTASVAPAVPFAAMSKTVAKDAFDNAFASFGTSKPEDKSAFDSAFASLGSKPSAEKPSESSAGKSLDAFNAEFPPISELERDDDESVSESDKGGFEDDFAPTSPLGKGKEKAETSDATAVAASSATEEKPKSDASTVTSANATPAPTSHTATDSGAPGMDNVFTSSANSPPPTTATAAQHAPSGSIDKKPSTPFDELDDEFEGLEDAKEGSADDEYANISRSGLDDFNPVFDSSPPPSQAKSESTAFGAESSFDFANVSEGSSGQPGSGRGVGAGHTLSQVVAAAASAATTSTRAADVIVKAPLSPDNQDWEALFASLDSPPGSAGTATASKPAESPADTIGATAATPTTTTMTMTMTMTATASAEKPPAIGRALTEEGLHDDPTLKQLVAMGYERSEALAALEKCNYDAERVSSSSSSTPPVAQQLFLDHVLRVLREQKVEKEKLQRLKQEEEKRKGKESEKEKEGEERWWS